MTSGLEHLVINIEHDIDEQYQYSPGEIIRGQITVFARRGLRLSAITMQVKGEGVVAWEDARSGRAYQTNEVYVNASHVLPESIEYSLFKGANEFNFQYRLPDNLPSSYIGKYGSVTYVIKATASGERRTDASITSEPFLVLRETVLPRASDEPRRVATRRRFHAPCGFGSVRIEATVHRTGVLPGEDFFVNAEIKNKSPRMVTAIQAALIMDARYHARNTGNFFRQLINRRRDEIELATNEGRRWQNVRLAVPPYIPESKLDGCDIIDVDYVFQLRVEVSGRKDICLDVPIIVASRHAVVQQVEQITRYDLKMATNNQWSDWSNGRRRKTSDDLNRAHGQFYESNGDVRYLHDKLHWSATMLPELRKDTKIENPLFDKSEGAIRDIGDVEMREEIIESTKL